MQLNETASIISFSAASFLLTTLVGLRSRTLGPSLVSYATHYVLAMGILGFAGLVAPDAVLYDQTAVNLVHQTTNAIAPGKEAWPYLLAGLYGVFGHIPALGLLVNVTAAALLVPLAAGTASRLKLPVRLTAWLAALLPTSFVWSTLLLRESLTWLLLMASIFAFAGLASKCWNPIPHHLVLVISLLGLLFVRGSVAIVVGVAGLVALSIARRQTIFLSVSAIIALIAVAGPWGAPILRIFANYNFQQIVASRNELSTTARTGFPIDNPLSVILRILVGPLPDEWRVVGSYFVFDGAIWVGILSLSLYAIVVLRSRRQVIVILLPVIGLLTVLAISSGNYGTMQRLRMQPEILLLPLAAAGFTALFCSPRKQFELPAHLTDLVSSTRPRKLNLRWR